jgi:hypothetical protein
MKIYKIILIIITFIPSLVYGQDVGKWRAGSAYRLAGNVYVFTCFVSGPDDQWTPEEKKAMLIKQRESEQWLTQQALKYNVKVFFEGESYGLTDDIKLSEIDRGTSSGRERVDMVSVVLAKIGYSRPLDLYNSLVAKTKCDNVQLLIFIKGQGNGYSMAYSSDMNKEKYFVEGSVLYEKYWNNEDLRPSSIAHETLHLYGAWDLYKTFEQTQENEDKATQAFPNSIMLKYFDVINDAEVDEVTAWLVGWNTSPKAWYERFRIPSE